jgi:hypothetical protein
MGTNTVKNLPIFDKEILISPGEWQSWLNHPITQEFMSAIKRERDDWSRMQAQGELLKEGMGTIEWYAKSVGIIYGLEYSLEGVGEALNEQWREAAERKEAAEREKENV